MHFVTGGAFNGKRAWVKNHYQQAEWYSAYDNQPLPRKLMGLVSGDILVLEGIELWLKSLALQYKQWECCEIWRQYLETWLAWEMANPERRIVVIGTDITKGIVPIESADRCWRDMVGWAFQDVAAVSAQVDLIWYGLNQTIKQRGQ
ncbi:bifunctional adenosylcobinamide kinase/adenosylcobinamide-phosphate guanylyltransferase [Bacillus rubiinfantis]|uniref:bifunctional adenosylcobinamide kinase/adenosylcobinamide-phosphate guanylyltransferase n=1 Tax=Bacillus rubiinfantis TaxID=1499680 RepID=UPI0005A6AE24|nr:bifunctional adenosylcobinamide kinase/adenosylcobinamide-phosphate guanylyltransferase [Bacillus rubiinfantis]